MLGHRLFPVGRLDSDSTGLLLLTDDGDLAYRLTHPRYKVAKEYVATVAGVLSPQDLTALRSGVNLDDGMTAPADVEVIKATSADRDSGRAVLRVAIREGRQRQVRRMLHAVGHKVQSLKRTAFGPLKLGRLKVGDWRVLGEKEVGALRRATGLDAQ
jgi:pseudouridine synthase